MVKETVCLASKTVELSEHPAYIELKNLLCYYDAPNENGVQLPSEEALIKAETLIDMPVVAKYRIVNGKPDLGGHEAYYDSKTKEVKFGTDTIGTHQSVYIEDTEIEIDGEIQKLPCLYAISRVWTRNKNVVEAIKRLFDEGKLTSSWEICVNAYDFRAGIKILTDYYFEANCLLGSNILPAYPCAKVTDLSALEQSQLMVAEAFIKDKEDNMDIDNKTVTVESETNHQDAVVIAEGTIEPSNETADNNIADNSDVVKEISQLTICDLRKKLSKLCRDAISPLYAWIAFIIVDEQYCLVDFDGSDEFEFYKFTYDIKDGEVVLVDEPEIITLLVSVHNINSAISSRDEQILSSQKQIDALSEQIAELEPYKQKVEQAEKEQAEKEKADKIEALKSLALSSGYITNDEIENDSEIQNMIASLNEMAIKSLIVDRMISQKTQTTEVSSTSKTVTSTIVKTDLEVDEIDVPINQVYVDSKRKR